MSSEETDPRSIHERIAALRRRMNAEGSVAVPPIPPPPVPEPVDKGYDTPPPIPPSSAAVPNDRSYDNVPPIPPDAVPSSKNSGGTPSRVAPTRIDTEKATPLTSPTPEPPVAAGDHPHAETKTSIQPPTPVRPATAKPYPNPARPAIAPPSTPVENRSAKLFLIAGTAAVLIGLAAWWFLDLRHRHSLTEAERSQAKGWFQDLSGQTWLLVQRANDAAPGQSMTISRPSVSADSYGKTTITVGIELSGYSDEYDMGRFETKMERLYTDLNEPRELDLCDDNPNAGEGSCLTLRIINTDSITVEIRDDEGGSTTYFGIPAERFAALQGASESARKLSLIHTVDSLTQNGGRLRRGIFRSYACGDECMASFLFTHDGQPVNASYVCNNNRFGDIQLSQGNMIGQGDFTNQTLVGQSFLIITERALVESEEGGTAHLEVITGLLPIKDEEITPELQQRLVIASSVDTLTATGTTNTAGSAQQFLDDRAVRELKDVQEQPVFPGGIEALYAYLGKSVRYPDFEKDSEIQGKVHVEFTVASDGSIRDVNVKRGVSQGLDREAFRVVSAMPRWTPGRLEGQAVSVRYVLPVNFVLQ